MPRSKRLPIEACAGSQCSIKDRCGRHSTSGRADYSLVKEFKITAPSACVMIARRK